MTTWQIIKLIGVAILLCIGASYVGFGKKPAPDKPAEPKE